MTQFLRRLWRWPTLIANGLIVHKVLLLLRSVGIRIEPYYFYQEGPFRPRPAGAVGEFAFVECGPDSFSEISTFLSDRPTSAELQKRLDEGQRCYALMDGDRIAAFSWCETGSIGFAPCQRPLERHEAYLFGAETRYEYRGRRIQPYLRYRCYEALNLEGRSLVYSYSDYFNYPAIRFKEKLGARILFTGLNVEIFGLLRKDWILGERAEVVDPPKEQEL